MADLVNLSDFSYRDGLNLEGGARSLTYLYGLSDFWHYIFQDTKTVNLLLEASSLQASDTYSKFLQLCCGISIEDIAVSGSSQLLLEIVSSDSGVGKISSITHGVWVGGFTTLTLESIEGLSVGDIVSVTGVRDSIIYDLGSGINIDAINEGGITSVVTGAEWNGTFSITDVNAATREITYYQSSTPGVYTSGGQLTLADIGIETYTLSDRITSSRFIANRPFLPTVVLEENVDFHIDPVAGRVSFAKKLSDYGFPSRVSSSGSTEYSLWFVDVRYDESLIYSSFPTLLGRQASLSTSESYRSFLYGLFYVYTSGPSISVMEKGLNLILGVPLARDNEVVLEIRDYLSTEQFIVITDFNSYIIPKGLSPTVTIGDSIKTGDELSKWVEILDNQNYPGWWNEYKVELPPSMLPDIPPGGYTRLITEDSSSSSSVVISTNKSAVGKAGIGMYPIGSSGTSSVTSTTSEYYTNWIMRNYLSNNTYLVKVNTSYNAFLLQQEFESISSIISDLKPSHTGAMYYYYSILPIKPVYTRGSVGSVGFIISGLPQGVICNLSQNNIGAGNPISVSSGEFLVSPPVADISPQLVAVDTAMSAGNISMGAGLNYNNLSLLAGYVIPVNMSPQILSVSDTAVGGGGVS